MLDQATVGRRRRRRIRPLLRAGGAAQDLATQGIGVRAREVVELHVAVVAGDADLEPRGAEQAGEERPHDVDALDAVEPAAAIGAEQDAAAHLDGLVGDAEGVHPPGEPEPGHEQRDGDQHHDQRERHQALGDEEVDRVALVAGHADEEVEQALAEVRDDDARDRDQRDAAAQQRGRRMKSVPLPVGELRARRRRRHRRHRRGLDRIGHSPARRVSASATSWSRNCSAASNWQAGDRHVRRGGRRHELQIGEADRARHRTARDVDELHPSVGNGDEPLEHDAAPEQQVVVAQPVADRADPSRREGERDDA